MPLARRIERLDAAEPVAKTLEDVLALGIEYVVADRHPAPAKQIHDHAGPAQGPAARELIDDMAPPSFGIIDHAQVEGAGEQRIVDRSGGNAAEMKAGLSAGETFMTGADHGRIDVKPRYRQPVKASCDDR